MDDPSKPVADSSHEAGREAAGAQLPLWPPEEAPASSDAAPAAESERPPETPPSPVAPEPPWNLRDLGAFVLYAAGTFLFANLLASAALLLLRRSLGWDIRADAVLTSTPFIVSMQVVWELLWFLFIYYTITAKYRREFWEAIRWRPTGQRPRHYILAGIGLAAAVQIIFSLLPSQKELPIERLFTSAASAYLLALFGICVAPFIEELVFRGFFYPVFERLWGILWAILLTAALFAVIHGPQLGGGWGEMAAIFGVGLALSYTRAKTGSLMPSFLMHLAYNASLFVSLYLSTDRFHALKR